MNKKKDPYRAEGSAAAADLQTLFMEAVQLHQKSQLSQAEEKYLLILAALPLMLDIDPWLTLWSLLSLPGITLLVLGFGNRMHRGYRDVQQFLGKLSIFVQESLAGIRVIQAHGQEATRQARFEQLSAEYMRKNLVTARLSGVLWPLMAVFSGLAAAVVLWLGGRRVLLGTLTIGQFVQFSGYLAMLTWPVMAIGYVVNLYQRGSAALGRLVEILETPPAPAHLTPDDGSPRRLTGAIEFRGLSFRYDPDWVTSPFARNLSLSLPITAGDSRLTGPEVGYYFDNLLATFYIRARVYDPTTGRWLSQDPLFYPAARQLALPGAPDPAAGFYRVFRGGSWINRSENLRCSERARNVPSHQSHIIGFRCARSAEPGESPAEGIQVRQDGNSLS